MSEIQTSTVDTDSLNFLKTVYFGGASNLYYAAANRAYLDMNRTIRFAGLPTKQRKEMHDFTCKLIEMTVKKLDMYPPRSQKQYDVWHQGLCDVIRKIYVDEGIQFYVGQSQKWLNMTMKYLYIIGACDFSGYFEFLHVPLDNYIFDIAQRELGVKKPEMAWSRMADYKSDYLEYEKELREVIDETAPIRWEFRAWLKEARNRT